MLNCPHCEKPSISFMRKSFLGPGVPTTCKECSGKVGVPWGRSLAVMAPFVIVAFGLCVVMESKLAPLFVGYLLGSFCCTAYLQWVPLEKR